MELKFIVEADCSRNEELEATRHRWSDLGWQSALDLHLATYNYPFVDYSTAAAFDTDRARMIGYIEEAPPPSRFLNSTSDNEIPVRVEAEFPHVTYAALLETGAPDQEALSLRDRFFLFCKASFAATGEKETGGVTTLRKTIPSGGARHPTEAYPIFFDDLIVPRGMYHFNVERNCLVQVNDLEPVEAMQRVSYHQLPTEEGAFAVAYTSVVPRAMWRYRDPRSSRAIWSDLGHCVEGANTNALALGFTPLSEYPFRESALSELLGKSFLKEPVLHVTYFQAY
jgi:SagB-type dehydrogenase family enzyme